MLEKADKQLLASHLRNEWTSFSYGTVDVEELWEKFKCRVNKALKKYLPTKWI